MPPIDDSYYAQKAKEILQTGDWLIMHIGGEVSLDNAPFYIWLIAFSFKIFGICEFSARFFSAFFGVMTILSVYFLGKMLFNRWVGLFSSFILLTTLLFFTFSRRTMVDVTLTFWITLAMIAFIKGMKDRKYFLLFGISTGITILTKSVLGLFPLVIAIFYLLMLKEFKIFREPYFLSGIAVAFAVSSPWYFYQYVSYPDKFVNVHLKWLIFKGALVRDDYRPVYWYLKMLWIYYWPWVPLATCSFIKLSVAGCRKADPKTLIVLCWAGLVIGLMSVLHSKKFHYIMPAFPALAILTAVFINDILRTERIKKIFMKICLVFLLFSAVIVSTTPARLPPRLSEKEYFENLVDETCSMALFSRDNLSKDDVVILYRVFLWRLKSTFLFYSDINIPAAIYDNNLLVKITKEKKQIYCLTIRENLGALLAIKGLKFNILKETPKLVLVKVLLP